MDTPENLVEYEGGDVYANLEDRTITGLLIPYNEVGRTNIGRFQVEAGAIELPEDPIVIGLNIDHVRHEVRGRATRVWEEPHGVMATFQIGKGEAGDAALAEATSTEDGKRRRLSGEFGPAMIRAGKLVAGHAKLWGAALVERGAFPSAQVLASDTEETTPATEATTTEGATIVSTTVEAGATPTATEQPQVLATTPALAPTTTNPAPAGQTAPRVPDSQQVFAAISDLRSNPMNTDARQVLAALTDITISGTNNLPGGGAAIRENWVGQVYQGLDYQREYITLGTLGTAISAGGKKGYKINRGTSGSPLAGPQDGSWNGNKNEINSYNGFTAAVTSTLWRFAVGNDIAREFYDLPGGAAVVEAFIRLLVEDYMFSSDAEALSAIVTAGTANIVAADTAAYSTAYPDIVGQIIQGILAVKAKKTDGRRDVPTFAILNDSGYEALMYAAGGEENLPAFMRLAVSTSSNGAADGNVQLVVGDIGIDNTDAVLVGAKRGIEFDELPGGPLHVNALDLANGGIDRAVHGYVQKFVVRPEAFVLVGTADA